MSNPLARASRVKQTQAYPRLTGYESAQIDLQATRCYLNNRLNQVHTIGTPTSNVPTQAEKPGPS